MADQNPVIENNQIQQIIYQQNPQTTNQPNAIQTPDGQIHYIVQEDDLQSDNFNLVQQATPQVFYQKIATENGQQIIQHGNYKCRKLAKKNEFEECVVYLNVCPISKQLSLLIFCMVAKSTNINVNLRRLCLGNTAFFRFIKRKNFHKNVMISN